MLVKWGQVKGVPSRVRVLFCKHINQIIMGNTPNSRLKIGWIPVEIQMPKSMDVCIVTNGGSLHIAWAKEDDDPGWLEYSTQETDTWFKDITHWMLIPKLPRKHK
jgi:hypothetical protein